MSAPTPERRPRSGLSRREVLRWGAVAAAGVVVGTPLPDLLARAAQVLPGSEILPDNSLWLSTDIVGLLERVAEDEERSMREGTPRRQVVLPEDALTLFLDRAEEIFRAAPDLHELYVFNATAVSFGYRPDVERLAASPYLGRLTSLTLVYCNAGAEG